MRGLKVAGLVAAGIIGVAVLLGIALGLFVDPNRYRGAIEKRVQEASGRPFAVSGAIKLEVFPWLALEVGKVTLGNPAGFGMEPQFVAERVRFGVRLMPLLAGHLQIDRVAVEGLSISLIKRADGHTNWEDLARQNSAGDKGQSADLNHASLAGIDLSRVSLTLRDDTGHSLTRIHDLEFHTGALGPARPVDLALSLIVDSGVQTPATRLALQTRAIVDTQRSVATLMDLKLSGERMLPAPATPTPFSLAAARLAIDWQKGTLASAKLDLQLGSLVLSAEASGEHLFAERILRGSIRMSEQPLRKLAAESGWALPLTRGADTFARLAVSAGFRITGHTLTLEDIDVLVDQTRMRGRVVIDTAQMPSIEADLHLDSIDVDAYRAPTEPGGTTVRPAEAKPSPLPVALLHAFNARGRVAIELVTLAGLSLTEVRMPFDLHDAQLRLVPSAKAFGGTAAGEIRLDASRDTPALAVTQDIRGVDVGAVFKAYAKSDRLSGRANAHTKLLGSGKTDAALLASLAGPIDVEIQSGALEGLDIAYEIQRAQALFNQQVPPGRSGPERTPFNALNSRSRLEQGVLATDTLQMETPLLKVTGKGTFRLSDQVVDYQLSAWLQEVRAPGASTAGSPRSIEIPLAVTGTVHDYKVRPDISGIVKGRVRQELDNQKQKLRDALKGKLQDLLSH